MDNGVFLCLSALVMADGYSFMELKESFAKWRFDRYYNKYFKKPPAEGDESE